MRIPWSKSAFLEVQSVTGFARVSRYPKVAGSDLFLLKIGATVNSYKNKSVILGFIICDFYCVSLQDIQPGPSMAMSMRWGTLDR